jgi:hypothetical protein
MEEHFCRTCGFWHTETDCPRWTDRQQDADTEMALAEHTLAAIEIILGA